MLLNETHLAVFFMRGGSLRVWDSSGLFDRELALYRKLFPHLGGITFVTHGDVRDRLFADRIDPIHLVCAAWRYPRRDDALDMLFGVGDEFLLVPKLHLLNHRGPMVIKSNQIKGAYVAMKTARLFRKKFIARCGYLLSEFMEGTYGPSSPLVRKARKLEKKVLTTADRVAVTTESMRQIVVERYPVPVEQVTVIPNYVETDRFCPKSDQTAKQNRICFVGRLAREKNLFSLLDAVRNLNVELDIVGSGRLLEELRAKANSQGISVKFLGSVPNRRLPDILNSCSILILPSLHEGHPKALLEAMACGLPVIGTNVPGIRDVIHHRENGLLCGITAVEIRAAIQGLLSDAKLRDYLGRNARRFVVEQCALDRVVKMELRMLQEVISK